MHKGFYIGGAVLAMAAALPAHGQYQDYKIEVVNGLSKKVKVCYYDSSDLARIAAKECVTIAAGKTGTFNKAQRNRKYKVRVFKPGLLDDPICFNNNYKFPPSGKQRIRVIGGKNCVQQKAIPQPGPSPTPTPAYKVGDAVLVGLRDNPENRQRRYFPAIIASANGGNQYRFKQLNGRSALLYGQYIRRDTVGEGTQILAKALNSKAYQFAQVKRRLGRLLEVEFNDGTTSFADMADVKLDQQDVPATAAQQEDHPGWVLRICNEKSGAVKAAAGFDAGKATEVSHGWFDVKSNQCSDIPVGALVVGPLDWYKNTDYIYAYAERVLAGGGVRRPVIEKPENAKSYCVKLKDNWNSIKQGSFGVVWAHCNGSGERLVPMTGIPLPTGGGIIEWTL